MKTTSTFTLPLLILYLFVSCLGCDNQPAHEIEMQAQFSSKETFVTALEKINVLVTADSLIAYLDTLPNGDPDAMGNTMLLSTFITSIIEKAVEGDLEGASYDVFHFDGSPFSLISFILKANMLNDISNDRVVDIIKEIPLPLVADSGYQPPLAPVVTEIEPPCPCAPEVKILTTWSYRPKCGNYTKSTSGYAANNTLNGMRRMTLYRFNAEVHGCDEGGTWTNTINCPANFSCRSIAGDQVTILAAAAGTVTITFTYACTCVHECKRTADATFSLNIR
jgi:hypothetical protein